jgi:hypothetical protein
MNNKKQVAINEPSDFEIRSMSVKLAVQHSRNCQASTLIKLAGSIYDFLKGNKPKKNTDE